MKDMKLLILEDNRDDAALIQATLRRAGPHFDTKVVSTRNDFIDALDSFVPEFVLSDHQLPQFSSSQALEITREKLPHVPFILVTGTVSEEFAASIIKLGADDYILKDRLTRLPAAIDAALRQRQLELAANRSQEIRRMIMSSALDAIVCIDMAGDITVWNSQAEKLFGWKENEIIGKKLTSTIIPVQYRHMHLEGFSNYKETGEGPVLNKLIEITALNSAGVEFPIELFIVPIKQDKENFFCAFIRDISERKKAEENLLQSQMRLNQAQAIAHLGNWGLNFETNTGKWSDEAYRIYGMTPGESLSMDKWLSFVHPDDLKSVKQKIEDAQLAPGDLKMNLRIVRKDGMVRYIYSETKTEFDKEGKPVGVYGIIHDITETKKLEAELFEQQRKEQLKITATALEAQEKERHAIGIELHDNVNQILVGTQLMLTAGLKNPGKAGEMIEVSIKYLQDAIKENRKIAHVFVAPDLDTETLVNHLETLIGNMLKSSGRITRITTPEFREDLLDKERKINIYRIAQEQCTNIVKYANATAVNIMLTTAGGVFKMIIADNGIGMEAGKKTTGIGLKNINGRLSIFNGTSNIITAPGKGFTLEITIPLKNNG